MPPVKRIQIPAISRLGIFPEGTDAGLGTGQSSVLSFDPVNRQTRTIDLAPLGSKPVGVNLSTNASWVSLSLRRGMIAEDTKVEVSIDWRHAPQGAAQATVTITPEGQSAVPIEIRRMSIPYDARGFIENAGVVAIDAEHTSSNEAANGVHWQTLPRFGLTLSGIEAFPVTVASTLPDASQACVEYNFTTLTEGPRILQAILAPTLPFMPNQGLRYSVQLDEQPVQPINAWARNTEGEWARAVSDGVHRVSSPLGVLSAGPHTLSFCRVDPGIVLERVLVFKSQPAEYLGPLESAQLRKNVE